MVTIDFTNHYSEALEMLTQWNANQTLMIRGLSTQTTPVIAFSNRATQTAVAVQARTVTGGYVCDIPNGLLTKPYTIYVDVRVSDGTGIKSIERGRIRVRPTSKPDDYEYVENITLVDITSFIADINTVKSEFNSIKSMVGGPSTAGTKAAMTDTSKVYVYTGSETGMVNGNWYYHDGTNWVSGGVYNAIAVDTDKTLSVDDMAADAAAAGSIIEVGSTQPSSEANKLWIDPSADEIEIPEMSDLKIVEDKVDDLKSDLSKGDIRIIDPDSPFPKTYSGAADSRFPYEMRRDATYRVSNNSPNSCSFLFYDASGGIIHTFGYIAVGASILVTASYDNVAAIGGYSSGGYNITVTVETDPSLLTSVVTNQGAEIDALKVVKPITTITVDLLEKGAWDGSNKSDYREANRARTVSQFYALNDIEIYGAYPVGGKAAMIILFNHDLTYKAFVTWASYVKINKGDIFTITLSETNNGSPASYTVEQIFSMFRVVAGDPKIANKIEPDKWTVVNGLIGSEDNKLYDQGGYGLSVLDYHRTRQSLLKTTVPSGYTAWIIGYDAAFNILKGRTVFGAKTGTMYTDVSDCYYIRLMLQGAIGISASEIANLTAEWNEPISVESPGTGTIFCLSKDGINNDGLSYAPSYPKSSVVSFDKAFHQGFRGMILHVQFTSDEVPVIYHDERINNWAVNPDGTAIGATVNIATSTLAQLDAYDFGLKFGTQYRGTKITRLTEALRWCKFHGVTPVIEQVSTLTNARNKIVCDMIKNCGMAETCGYAGYKLESLQYVHTQLPDADLLWSPSDGEAFFMAHLSDYIALRGNNDIYLWAGLSYSAANIQTIIDTGKVKFMQSPGDGTEPDNFIDRINDKLWINGMVSQIVPAYSAMQKI